MNVGSHLRERLRRLTFELGGEQAQRKLEGLAADTNEYGVDPFGMDLDYAIAAAGPLLWLYKNYFRVRTYGLEKVPQGRVLLVSNHSRPLPIDGAMIAVSMLVQADPPRAVRPVLWLYTNSCRGRAYALEKVPQGRVLLVSNHSGQLPIDGAMIAVSMLVEADPPRAVRSMLARWVPTLPYISTIFARCGQVVGT